MPTLNIGFVIFPNLTQLDFTGPLQVLSRVPGSAMQIIAKSEAPVPSDCGLSLVPTYTFATAPQLDLICVPGGFGVVEAIRDPQTVEFVRGQAKGAKYVTSVCTGAFVLGAARLLDHRRVTTHWAWCDALARRFPAALVDPDPIFVNDGPIWTSAGVTAGIDLALALVEADAGRELALEVARYLVMFVRRAGGQSQFSAQLSTQAAERRPLRDLQAWIAEHHAAPLGIPKLAARAHMSVRNFSRTFTREVGCTPAAYVERTRLDVARRMLEESDLSIEEVAARSGFGTPEALRRAFARRVGLPPREYRSRFRPALHATGT